MYDIANQCPISGGPAVYHARSLYFYIDDQVIYDDKMTCLNGGINFKHESKVQESFAHLYPNPAKDEATLMYTIFEDGTFELYDALGEKQLMNKLQSKLHQYTIDVSKLNNGVYYYKVICCGVVTGTGKLVITR